MTHEPMHPAQAFEEFDTIHEDGEARTGRARTPRDARARRRPYVAALLLAAGLALSACGGNAADPGDEPGNGQVEQPGEEPGIEEPGGADVVPGEGRPETKSSVLFLEGMPEGFEFNLFASAELPLAFSTFVPDDMAASIVTTDHGPAAQIVTNFAGQRNEEARLEVRVLNEGMSLDEAIAEIEAIAAELGTRERHADDPDVFDWSLAEAYFQYDGEAGTVVGTLAVGEALGRTFVVRQQYPQEFGDGFLPRAHRILEEWRWETAGDQAWLIEQRPDGEDVPRVGVTTDNFRVFLPKYGQGVRGGVVRVVGEARVFEGHFKIELEDGHNILAEEYLQVEGAPAWGAFDIELAYDEPTNPVGTLIFIFDNMMDGSRDEDVLIPLVFLDE